MVQNRNKLIELFIGNIANCVTHKILEQSADNSGIADKYKKESTTSFEIAKRYREKINPVKTALPDKDRDYAQRRE